MHAQQARSPWARASPPLSRRRGDAAVRHLSRPRNICKGVVCSKDYHTHDRDRPAARPFDDPHQTPPPRPAAAAAHQHHAAQPPRPPPEPSFELLSSLSTSDLEFGEDALTGSTLETPEQLAQQYRHPHQRQQERERQERMHQADIAREAAEAREAAQGIARLVLEGLSEEGEARAAREDSVEDALFMSARDAQEARREEAAAAARSALASGESTAAEREDRYAGILQALDSLGARDACGASDDEGQAVSPEAARLTTSGSVENEEEAAFDTLRHTVDMLGEGEEAAELIMESYKGRNLEAEALSTMDPADSMPHPGDRYLPPNAARGHGPPPGGMAARLNSLHSRSAPACKPLFGPDFERRHGPLLPPARGTPGSQGQQFGSRCRGSGASAWMPPDGGPTAARAQHDPVGGGGEAEGQGADAAPIRAGAGGTDAAADRAAAGSPDDQIELQDAWRHAGPVGEDPAASGAGTADDQIDFEQDILRGADALYYAPEHAATPAVNDSALGGRAGAGPSSANVEAPEEGYDVEGDALRGSDSMFYFKSARGPSPHPSQDGSSKKGAAGGVPAGGGAKEPDHGTVWGALASRDEQHGGFRRAMEEAAAEASGRLYAKDLKKAAGGKQRLPPEVAGPPRAPLPAAAAGKGEAAAADDDVGDGRCQQPYQAGILSLLRRRQGERKEAERSLDRLVARLHPSRTPGDPGPPTAARVIETAMGRSAALGLCAAVVTEVLTQQSVLSQLLGRFEGSYQIELARSTSQAATLGVLAVAVLLTMAERVAGGGAVPHWRLLGLAPSTQVWLGRAAMVLFALLLAYETVHSNRPAFGTLFYLWP